MISVVAVFRKRSTFRDEQESRNWIQSQLREALGSPEVHLEKNTAGKPHLRGSSLAISISHTSEWLALAWIPESAKQVGFSLGIDLEDPSRKVDELKLASRFFHPDEAKALASLDSEAARKAAFFRLWTRKEAIVKCKGSALARELRHLEPSDLVIGTEPFVGGLLLSVALQCPSERNVQSTRELSIQQRIYWSG